MSDKLNEKFGKFATEQKVIVEAGDPMPTVSANVIPGTGSEPSQVSDAQTKSGSGKDPAPKVEPSQSYGQSAPADLGGTSTTPNEHDDDGEDNPGAKAAAPVGDKAAQSDGSAQTSSIKDAGDMGKQPTVCCISTNGRLFTHITSIFDRRCLSRTITLCCFISYRSSCFSTRIIFSIIVMLIRSGGCTTKICRSRLTI
jgi:hypothetical protein